MTTTSYAPLNSDLPANNRRQETEDYIRMARRLRAEAVAGVLTRVATGVGTVYGRIRRYFEEQARRRQTYHELMQLDDRTLADIGLNRFDVELLATGRLGGIAAPEAEESASYDRALVFDFPSRAASDRLRRAFARSTGQKRAA